MSKSTVASRYAQALFELALQNGQVDIVEADLRVVREVFEKNPEYTLLLQSPKVTKEQKKQLIQQAFNGLSSYVINTLSILIDRRRDNEIAALADAFIELSLTSRGTAVAYVSSATKLSEADQALVSQVFAGRVGKSNLQIQNHVDSSLLGGMSVRIGNRIFDGTLRSKLQRLERELKR
ncbi:F0F1 ATP synthase subunit delta [Jeotgalibacillus proteolyticus]|uniref:ATP synthase subunit delta n=1 Tax=Jeotgalibacillus proteolyticus TaxID=2082395 RepID=A0A2S5G9C6_9BACL|nr:F0F1 ATP synthase subunit delta [Jeotgalibacillus proteolyticus]PPA69596.1 F0F1 ATP synthase subunit delta [Jeotgalibacillus proteolyticus]